MRIAIIGGGSSYSPELVDGLLQFSDRFPRIDLAMMDVDADRLRITAEFARRMADRRQASVRITASQDLDGAVADADYVVAQIRVGGIAARIEDERLGRRHGLIGQETTGVGGFACALRTIPAMLRVADAMRRRAPNAVLINFTNPAGLITEALVRHGGVPSVGLCNIPIGIEHELAKLLGCAPDAVRAASVGLNHLSWMTGVSVDGVDRTAAALDALWANAQEEWEDPATCAAMLDVMRRLGMYCNGYLKYFYATERMLRLQAAQTKTRGEEVIEIEARLFEAYRDPSRSEKPSALSERGGAHYSSAALRLIDAMERDDGAVQTVSCRNGGAIPTFDDDAVVEAPARIRRRGAETLPQAAPPPAIRGLMQAIKAYETLTVQAGVSGDRDAAYEAMLIHPLMPGAERCGILLDDVLATNQSHLTGTFY